MTDRGENKEFDIVFEGVGRDPYVTSPRNFNLDNEIDSPASEEELRSLIDAAKKGCFIEQTLAVSNTVTHRLKTDGGWIDV